MGPLQSHACVLIPAFNHSPLFTAFEVRQYPFGCIFKREFEKDTSLSSLGHDMLDYDESVAMLHFTESSTTLPSCLRCQISDILSASGGSRLSCISSLLNTWNSDSKRKSRSASGHTRLTHVKITQLWIQC